MPLVGAILLDIYNSWNRGDIVNIIRHSTVVGPFTAGLLKVKVLCWISFIACSVDVCRHMYS